MCVFIAGEGVRVQADWWQWQEKGTFFPRVSFVVLSVPKNKYLMTLNILLGQTLLWERLGEPAERKNERPRSSLGTPIPHLHV